MKQEQKELLLKDLCARLPYGVICKSVNFKNPTKLVTIDLDGPLRDVYFCTNDDGSMWNNYDEIKPYLFPRSSMTKEQKKEYTNLCETILDDLGYPATFDTIDSLNWLLKNNFDIYGLIPMGLAIDATGKNIY